jgi:hypothetical protein
VGGAEAQLINSSAAVISIPGFLTIAKDEMQRENRKLSKFSIPD